MILGLQQQPKPKESLFGSFTLSFLSILVSEIGDKTFFLAALMAMKYDKLIVFAGAYGALVVMTFLSTVLGTVSTQLVSKGLVDVLAAIFFFALGIKLLYEQLKPAEQNEDECHSQANSEEQEVEIELKALEERLVENRPEGGRGEGPPVPDLRYTILAQAFIMTFLAEWLDRSQITTVTLAMTSNFWMVSLGACLGHLLCTGAAVVSGKMLSTLVTERQINIAAGVVFILCGVITIVPYIF